MGCVAKGKEGVSQPVAIRMKALSASKKHL
jgi:hypothetical protein